MDERVVEEGRTTTSVERVSRQVSVGRSTRDEAVGPFLKWAGGKTRLLAQLDAHFPTTWNRYHEPFLGGGAVFFHLDPQHARLSDGNPRLIQTWQVIQSAPEALMREVARLRSQHSRAWYYRCRDRFNAEDVEPLERAALMLYLNKTCFNGLYRENRKGGFNVPFGQYRNPTIADVDQLRAVSRRLQGVELAHADFREVLNHARSGDFVYFDPPYVPISQTAAFTSYLGAGFDDGLQRTLADAFDELARRGCHVMLSNSDCAMVRELYRAWRVETVLAPRSISRDGANRSGVSEVVVCSWERARRTTVQVPRAESVLNA